VVLLPETVRKYGRYALAMCLIHKAYYTEVVENSTILAACLRPPALPMPFGPMHPSRSWPPLLPSPPCSRRRRS